MISRVVIFICAGLLVLSCVPGEGSNPEINDGPSIKLEFDGKTGLSPNYVYVTWLEDTAGRNIQNLYVCPRAMPPNTNGLQGHGLPVWSRPTDGAYYEHTEIDALSGSTPVGTVEIEATLTNRAIRKFYVFFEIDRSLNGNTYFTDRPAFLYKSELIDLDNLKPSYNFTLTGWMINDTHSGTYSQAPKDMNDFPGYTNVSDLMYQFMTDLSYIAPVDDMIISLSASVNVE